MVPPRSVEDVPLEILGLREGRDGGLTEPSDARDEDVARLDGFRTGDPVLDAESPDTVRVDGVFDGRLERDVAKLELVNNLVHVCRLWSEPYDLEQHSSATNTPGFASGQASGIQSP